MDITVIVEKRIGVLPDIRWKSLFEDTIQIDIDDDVLNLFESIHLLFQNHPHRIVLTSNCYEV